MPVGKNRFWVLKVVGGGAAVKGDLQHATLLEQLYTDLREGRGDRVGDALSFEKAALAAARAKSSSVSDAHCLRRSACGNLISVPVGLPAFSSPSLGLVRRIGKCWF